MLHFMTKQMVAFRLQLPPDGTRSCAIIDTKHPCWRFGFLKSDVEILFFFKSKKVDEIWLFPVREAWLGKTLSELRIHCKSLLTRVYDHVGCKEYCNDFTVALAIFDVYYKTQKFDSVVMGKKTASKDWDCSISMFLTGFIMYCVWVCIRSQNEGEESGNPSPGVQLLRGRRKVLPISQVLSSIDYICFVRT